MWFGQDNEVLALPPTPSGRNGDAIFLVNRVTKFAGKKGLGCQVGVHGTAVVE